MKISKHLWKKVNITTKEFSFVKVRHSIVTNVHRKKSNLKDALTDQMQHSTRTASKYYKDFNTTKASQENF